MPTRLLLEGPDISSLLERIRNEHGPGVRIVSADKVRTGGVAGFFAKERFEVAVDVSTVDDVDVSTVDAEAQALVVQTPEAPHVETFPGRPTGGTDDRPLVRAAGAPGDTAAGSLGELAERADADEVSWSTPIATRPIAAPAPGLIAPTAPIPPPPEPAFEVPTVSTESRGFADMLASLTEQIIRTAPDQSPPPVEREPFRPAPFVPSSAVPPALDGTNNAQVSPPANAVPEVAAVAAALVAVAPVAAEPAPAPPIDPPAGRHRPARHVATRPVADQLVELGMPAELAAGIGDRDVYAGLLSAFDSIPSAPVPRARPGDVVVVTGDLAAALDAGADVARALHVDPEGVLLVTVGRGRGVVPAARLVSGPADAERRARRMHRDTVPHVVVIDTPLDADGPMWASEIADAFSASAVFAVVDATRKTGDLRRHLDALGQVDALIVRNAAATADPATVLGLDVPVRSVDGCAATPALWASLLHNLLDIADDACDPRR